MTHVIRILKKDLFIEKPLYTPEFRKEFSVWPKSYHATGGYMEGKTLLLPQKHQQSAIAEKETSCILIIEDILKKEVEILAFKRPNTPWHYQFLSIHYASNLAFPVYLNYTKNDAFLGAPTRHDHKICELKLETPILYKLNGKIDWARRQRRFREIELLISYLGEADAIEIRQTATTDILTTSQATQLVDERKILS